MTLAEVEAILGKGQVRGATLSGGLYTWKNDDGSSINVSIMDGRVIGKLRGD